MVANSSVLSCPVAFGKTVIFVYYQVACYLLTSFSCGEVVCPVVKDLVCLSELPLIPMLHQSEQSAMAVVFVRRPIAFRC